MNNALLSLRNTDSKVEKPVKNLESKSKNSKTEENKEFSDFVIGFKLLNMEKVKKSTNRSKEGVDALLNKNINLLKKTINKNPLIADVEESSKSKKLKIEKDDILSESLKFINIKLIKNNLESKNIKNPNLELLNNNSKLKNINLNDKNKANMKNDKYNLETELSPDKDFNIKNKAKNLDSEFKNLKEKTMTNKEIILKENSENTSKEKLNFKDTLNLLKKNNAQKMTPDINNVKSSENSKGMENVKTQIHDTITYLSQNNKKQVVLKLMPQSLGKLDINISQINESTKVEIKVQNQETLQLLNDNQTSLKDLFSAIKKTGNDISFSFDKNNNPQESSKDENKQKNKKIKIEENKFNYLESETMTNYVGLIEIVV